MGSYLLLDVASDFKVVIYLFRSYTPLPEQSMLFLQGNAKQRRTPARRRDTADELHSINEVHSTLARISVRIHMVIIAITAQIH